MRSPKRNPTAHAGAHGSRAVVPSIGGKRNSGARRALQEADESRIRNKMFQRNRMPRMSPRRYTVRAARAARRGRGTIGRGA
ncbi:hypothetical protein BURMUCF2_A1960, partial [Burkholderia multivorans CF2]